MAVLTIDDAPSSLFREKTAWLKEHCIPALFFIWGEKAAGEEEALADAVRSGFELGNHSWTHTGFSSLDLEEARKEIEMADSLIARIYRRAGIPWRQKRFRFPYFDRGGDNAREKALQGILGEFGYVALGGGATEARDTLCGFDQEDYRLAHADASGIPIPPEAILDRIGPGRPARSDVILIHDLDYAHLLFFECVDRYRKFGIEFERPI